MRISDVEAATYSEMGWGAPHCHFLPCHSFSHTTLKSPCVEQAPRARCPRGRSTKRRRREPAAWHLQGQGPRQSRLVCVRAAENHMILRCTPRNHMILYIYIYIYILRTTNACTLTPTRARAPKPRQPVCSNQRQLTLWPHQLPAQRRLSRRSASPCLCRRHSFGRQHSCSGLAFQETPRSSLSTTPRDLPLRDTSLCCPWMRGHLSAREIRTAPLQACTAH